MLLMMERELAQNEKWQNIEGNINFPREAYFTWQQDDWKIKNF